MLNKIIGFSIRNKLIIGLFTAALIIWGGYETTRLPIDALPDITDNQVQVLTVSPSLGAPDVERLITFPIEQACSNIPGLKQIRSFSRFGLSLITVVFDEDTDLYWARQQIGERLQQVTRDLPEGIGTPELAPISTGLGEIYQYVVRPLPGYEDQYSSMELRTIQDWIVRRRLLGTPGVADVSSFGGHLKQYEIAIRQERLKAHGLSITDIFDALERNNQNTGGAYIEKGPTVLYIRSEGLTGGTEDIGNIVVRTQQNGMPLLVRDVAKVGLGSAIRYGAMTYNDQGEVAGAVVMMLKGENAATVVKRIKERVAEIQKDLPEGVVIEPFLDRTKMVNNAIATVETNLIEGALIVVFVLVFFLGSLRAGLIVSSVIPLSMLFAIILMNRFGVGGNLMSLGAIDFGLIVDGSVIVVEAIMHRLSHSKLFRGIARISQQDMDKEVGHSAGHTIKSAVFSQIIILIVYLPILSLQGIEGKMFQPMAMTVIFALVSAFVLSLTLIPALVGIFMTGKVTEKENFLVRSALWAYRPIVRWAVKLRYVVVLAAIAAFAGSVLLFLTLGQEFVPTLDEKDIAMQALRIPSTSLTQSSEMQLAIEKVVQAFPEVAFVYSKTGTAEMAADPMPPSATDTFIILKSKVQWPDPDETKAHFIERLEDAVKKVPGSNFEFTQPIEMRFNELVSGVRGDVAVKVYGDKFEEITPVAEAIAAVLQSIPGAADVKVEQTEGLPVMNIKIDRDKIARYGLNMADVQDVIAIAVGGREAGVVFQGDRRFDLVVRLPEDIRKNVDALLSLPIPLPEAESGHQDSITLASNDRTAGHNAIKALPFVSLGAVADIAIEEGPNQISRDNGKRRIVVQANVRGSDLGTYVKEAQQKVDQQVKLTAGTWLEWGGQFENLVSAKKRLSLIVPICLFVIFLLLFSTFNSAKYALLVFSGIPLALSGGIVALWLRDIPFSISAAVGFIALSGVAVLNGLVMVTFINQLRQDGEPLEEAIVTGSITRLRPVLMTALVASLGFVPMAMASGAGAEVQKPLATVVIGGIISSTLLTLLVLPALYRIFHFKDDVLLASDSAPAHHNPELVHETETP